MFASPLKTCPQSSATAGEPVDHPEPLQQLERQPQRQAHYTEEVAADSFDQRRALALDRVGAGLVERLPGRVGRAHHGPPLAPCHRRRLFSGQPRHISLGLLGRPEALIHFGRHHAKLEPDHLEQLASAWGSARQDDHFSRISVTGPSFTSSTSIIAPNSPVATCTPLPAPRSLRRATNCSYNGTASSGGAASMKLGRRPFCTSPYSVN